MDGGGGGGGVRSPIISVLALTLFYSGDWVGLR